MVDATPLHPHAPSFDDCLPAPSETTGSSLRVAVERLGTAVVLRVSGDVDASNIAAWRRVLAQVAGATTAPGTLVVDTRCLTFMAVCGFAALADTSTHCRRRGIALHVVGDRPALARVITVCGWQTELPVYRSVAAALQTCPVPDATPAN